MNTKVLRNIGITLKKIRKQKGYTQEYIAEKINIHPTYVGKIEAGKANISAIMLFKFSRVLDVKLTDIFEFDK